MLQEHQGKDGLIHLKLNNARWVGKWDETKKAYIAPRDRRKHFSTKLRAWGFDREVITWLEKRGCLWVVIDLGKGEPRPCTQFSRVLVDGFAYTLSPAFGEQWFVHDRHWMPAESWEGGP